MPIVKSLGGKTWLRDELWKYYNRACRSRGKDLRWVDPFCGGLAAPFYIMPNDAWVNDLNIHLINFYNHIMEYGTMREYDPNANEEEFYQKRAQFNKNISEGKVTGQEMAELFYYLNKTCYGGISRYNNSGLFNAPFGKKTAKASYAQEFPFEQRVLKEWKVTCLHYEDVLKEVDEDDFLFVDPPYDEVYNKYIERSFNWNDQVALATALSKLPNPIIATNSNSERVVNLYKDLGFEVKFKVRRDNLQQARAGKGRCDKYKESVFYKNIKVIKDDE